MSKVLVSETNLTAIADAIRTKKGSEDTYKPGEMAAAINSITTGSGGEGLPEGALTIKGDCKYRFANDGWNWFLENYGNQATCDITITNTESMFENCSLSTIPMKLKAGLQNKTAKKMFYNCQNLTTAPTLDGILSINFDASSMFENCYSLKTFPRYFFAYWRRTDNINAHSMFRNCRSLEKVPDNLFDIVDGSTPDGTVVYYPKIISIDSAIYMFNGCYKLREIINFPSYGRESSSKNNFFDSAFNGLYMLNRFTFKPLYGTEARFYNVVVDLSNNVGWTFGQTVEGFDTAKCVSDDTTYQALKNTKDWWSYRDEYSRYNKTSAEETIKSLPKIITIDFVSAADYTNIIKFRGEAGSLTDGGAINTISEEIIAAAAAKGWTVAFV